LGKLKTIVAETVNGTLPRIYKFADFKVGSFGKKDLPGVYYLINLNNNNGKSFKETKSRRG